MCPSFLSNKGVKFPAKSNYIQCELAVAILVYFDFVVLFLLLKGSLVSGLTPADEKGHVRCVERQEGPGRQTSPEPQQSSICDELGALSL